MSGILAKLGIGAFWLYQEPFGGGEPRICGPFRTSTTPLSGGRHYHPVYVRWHLRPPQGATVLPEIR